MARKSNRDQEGPKEETSGWPEGDWVWAFDVDEGKYTWVRKDGQK